MVLISQVTMQRAGIETIKTNHGVLKILEHTPDTKWHASRIYGSRIWHFTWKLEASM